MDDARIGSRIATVGPVRVRCTTTAAAIALLAASCTNATESSDSATETTDPAATSTTSSTVLESTTTTEPPLAVYDPQCVVEVQTGDSLGAIASARADELVTIASIQAENGFTGDLIVPDQLLDVCIDNGLDDISGEQRLERNAAIVAIENHESGVALQAKLNALLTPYGFPEMPVDGISGAVTQRGLCAARVALGLPVHRGVMEPGSEEEAMLLAMETFPVPPNVATDDRWVFIDLTCQVMFVGQGNGLVFVFPTSTGDAENKTRLQEHTRAFRFDPALENGGWHNSSTYPVPEDNPLNGNMYKPIYFDNGQAIHGANSVPTSPQSKGCARLRSEHQDALVAWLGLADVGGPVGGGRINATVTVRGDYDFG